MTLDEVMREVHEVATLTAPDHDRVRAAISSYAATAVRAAYEATAAFYGLTDVELIGGAKSPRIVRARRVAAVLMRETGASYSEIGRALGYTDHSGVHQAIAEVTELAKTDEALQADLEAVRTAARAGKRDPLKERVERLELELAALRDELRRRL